MKQNNENQKRFQFSKAIVFVTGAIFILTLMYCLYLMQTVGLDLTLGITAITSTAGMFGASIIWYLKKSQAENVIKLRTSYMREVAKTEWELYEKKARLKKELSLEDDYDLNDSHINNMCDEAISSGDSYLSQQFENATTDPEIEIM